MGDAEDVADSGDLAGVVDASAGDASAVIFQADIAHTGAGEDQVVEIAHRAIEVDECMIEKVADHELRIANDLAGAVDCVGVAIFSAKCTEIDVIAAGAAKERRVNLTAPRQVGGANNLSSIVNAIGRASQAA